MESITTHSWRVLLAVAAFSVSLSSPVRAGNLIVNGSFENTGGTFVDEGGGVMNAALPVGSTLVPGWTVTNAQLGWISNANIYGVATPFGSYFLDLTGNHDNSIYAGVTQTIVTTPNQAYTLTLSLGADQGQPLNSGTKSVSVTAGSSSTSFTFVPSGVGNQWKNFSFDFVAVATSTQITIVGTSSGAGYQYLGLDNVSVAPQVPSLGLPGLAALAVVMALVAAARLRRVSARRVPC
ncbi:MAG TPA: DUF642 domain-containing protein [Myxococcota bacterium]|nr:DUF642 domain-containing protein [Myxococcota bacterium]